MVESFTSRAAAQSAPGAAAGGLSFITILICNASTTTCYRMKFDVSCLTGPTSSVTTSTCPSGGCGTGPTDDHCPVDPTLTAPNGYTLATTCAPGTITGNYLGSVADGSPVFTITNSSTTNYTLQAWQSHRGSCCAGTNCASVVDGPASGTSFNTSGTLTFDQIPNKCTPKDGCP